MRTGAVFLALALAGTATGAIQVAPSLEPPPLPAALAHVVDPVISAAWSNFDMRAALGHVQFVSQYWRLPGNEGYDKTIDRVRARLIAAGFPEKNLHIEEYPNTGRGWDHSIGRLAIAHPGRADEVLLSKAKQHIALCMNSFSTPPGGVVAPLVDVGRGDRDDDYATKDLKGAVVLGDADVGQLWRRAIAKGAIGVVSPALGDYISPDFPGAKETPRDQWDVLQWSSIPYDEATHGFGFKSTPKAAAAMRRALARGPVNVHVTIASTFSTNPTRTLVAEIPGSSAPDERIVLAAHVQEPGANDNASGVATLTELVRALSVGIQQHRIPAPARTLTFLWLNEISGSRQWLTDHADQAKNVRYMLSMDMTGEDVKKTGGSFLIERYPDPGAVWDRPWDPHSEWGRGNVRAEQLKGDLINDLHLAICARVAKKTNWVVKTNPYEGGSDHTVFGAAGIPSVLNWHFTDRYYHSSLDTADKTSPAEMRNVGVSVATTAWLMASAKEADTIAVADMVSAAGQKRLAIELKEGPKVPLVSPSQDVASREASILAAWRKWYGEAVMSATRLIVGQPGPTFEGRLRELAAAFENAPAADASQARPTPTSSVSAEGVLLAADRLQADRWYSPPNVDPPAGAPEDWALLRSALSSSNADVRRVAVRAFGRFENPAFVAVILPFLDDKDARVRDEATNAVCIALRTTNGGDTVLRALKAFQDHGAIAAIGRLRLDAATADQVERWLLAKSDAGRPSDDLVAALAGLTRLQMGRLLLPESLALLRRAALEGDRSEPPNLVAMAALQRSHDLADTDWLVKGARYRCPGDSAECGWPVRFAAVQLLDRRIALEAAALEQATHDSAFQVRLAALEHLGCEAMLAALAVPSEVSAVRLELISSARANIQSISTQCSPSSDAPGVLRPIASRLTTVGGDWHEPARALEALAILDPASASRLLRDAALAHPVWQVRAAAARAATLLSDDASLVRLSRDAVPNVRTEALRGLSRLKSVNLVATAVAALESSDHQLVREAATVIPESANRERAVPALLRALDRLTNDGKDNSRDARLAIVTRLQKLQAGANLSAYLSDFDPAIAAAAAAAIEVSGQPRPTPHPARRASQQPTEAALRALPKHATITMGDGGVMELDLLVDQAPLTVARFVALARAGYYDGLTFHRVEPLFVILGGSPGASEYVGDARFMRDEVGARHIRGAVGISTRGRDTGDAQMFIDLVDQPRLNDNYTVFAQVRDVSASNTVMDRVLEGAVIKTVRIN